MVVVDTTLLLAVTLSVALVLASVLGTALPLEAFFLVLATFANYLGGTLLLLVASLISLPSILM